YPKNETGSRSADGAIVENIVKDLCLELDMEEVVIEGIEDVVAQATKEGREIVVVSKSIIGDELIVKTLTEKYGVRAFVCHSMVGEGGRKNDHMRTVITARGAFLISGLPEIVLDKLAVTGAPVSLYTSEAGLDSRVYIGPPQNNKGMEMAIGVIKANTFKGYYKNRHMADPDAVAKTMDGRQFKIYANMNVPGHLRKGDAGIDEDGALDILEMAYKYGANGVALGRTEYMYTRQSPPDFGQQTDLYRAIADYRDSPVTLRTFDKRDDKECLALPNVPKTYGFDYYKIDQGREALKTQIKALLAAFAASRYKNIKMEFPNIKTLNDTQFIYGVLEEAKSELVLLGHDKSVLDRMPIGIMVEERDLVMDQDGATSEYKVTLRNLKEVLDAWKDGDAEGNAIRKAIKISFMSIGTNDLISTVKRMDRTMITDAQFDKQILSIEEAVVAEAAARDMDVSVCGDVARLPKEMFFSLAWQEKYGTQLVPGVIYEMIPKMKTHVEFCSAGKCAGILQDWNARNDNDINSSVDEKVGVIVSRIEGDEVFKRLLNERLEIAAGVTQEEVSGRPDAILKMDPTVTLAVIVAVLGASLPQILLMIAIAIMAPIALKYAVKLFRPKARTIIPKTVKIERPSEKGGLIIGVKISMSEARQTLEDLEGAFAGSDIDVVMVSDAEHLAVMAKEKKRPAVLIDIPVTARNLKTAAGYITALSEEARTAIESRETAKLAKYYEVVLTMDTVSSEIRNKIAAIIKELLGDIRPEDFEQALKSFIARGQVSDIDRAKVEALRALVIQRGRELASARGAMAMTANVSGKRAGFARTDTVAMQDPTFAEDVKRTRVEYGIKTALIYGEAIKDPAEALRFIEALGLTTDEVELIDKRDYASYDELRTKIASKAGADITNVGIMAAESDNLLKGASAGEEKFLQIQEVRVNGVKVLATMNAYRTLLTMVFAATADGRLPPGVTKEDGIRGIYNYLPPTLPIDFGTEIETFRRAVELIRTAA
ncbi:MAG: hypothetical protein NTZ95_02275, partial [Candidatus Omnitrophica bacterium]|nr:hypothetical protein [Candidatus Omnitrophota bacterium]